MDFQNESLPAQLSAFRHALDGLISTFDEMSRRAKLGPNFSNFDQLANACRVAKYFASVRRDRSKFFADDLFGEPAWDILLDLFVASADERPISVTSACHASGVPLTTALRCLDNLVRHGLVARSPDKEDRRRAIVSLTPQGYDAVARWIAAANDKLAAL